MSKLLIVHTVCTPPKVECQTISTSSQAVRKRQEVPFVQDPTLKIKEDLLHKLSRDHLLEEWKGEAEWPFRGSEALPVAVEGGGGLRRGHAGQAGEMLWEQNPQQL